MIKKLVNKAMNGNGEASDQQVSTGHWEYPKDNVQDELGFECLREDGVMRVEKGKYALAIEFDDVNYQGALETTQLDIHSNMNELYNSLPDNCELQLFMYTRRLHDEEIMDSLLIEKTSNDDGYNEFRDELNSIVKMKMSETCQNVKRVHCFIITCRAENADRAKVALNRIATGIERKLTDIESKHHVLSGIEWLELINHITNPDTPEGVISYDDLDAMKGHRMRDFVAPDCLKVYGNKMFSMGKYYYKCLYVKKFANSVRDNFLSSIAEMPYNSIISMHAIPFETGKGIELVEGKLTQLDMSKHDYIKRHPENAFLDEDMLPSNMGSHLKNTRETKEDLVKRDQSLFNMSLTCMLFSDDKEELDNAVSELERIVKSHNFEMGEFYDMQLLGLKSALPTGNSAVPIERTIMTDALSNFEPFTSDELMESGGMFGGINQLSKNIIAYDRTKSLSPNGFILGKPGRGKSVSAKYQIIQLLCKDPKARCLVIDPEGEYGALCELLPNSQKVVIKNGGDVHINPMDINTSYVDNTKEGLEEPLSFKVDFLTSLVEMMSQGMNQVQLNVLDRCARRVYDDYFASGAKADMPTLQNLYDELKKQPEIESSQLATNIERYVTGSLNVFNNQTNINLNSRLVVFDIKECKGSLLTVALLVVLNHIWNMITEGRDSGNHTWFYVDEMQLLKDNQYAVNFLDTLFSRARKWGAVPTGITQNVERVLRIDGFRFMISNSDFLMILGQSKTDCEAIADLLKLSDEQKRGLRTAGKGEGVLVVANKVIQFENIIPDKIGGKPSKVYRALTTKLEDLVELGIIEEK